MSKALQTTTDSVQTFINLFHGAQSSLIALGEHTAASIDADPDFADKVCLAYPELTMEFIHKCELVGRKKLHPRLVISEGPGVSRLRRMPLALQEKFISQPLPLVIRKDNNVEILNVDLLNLSADQAKQVFDCEKQEVRSEAAQRAWLEDQAAKALPPTPKGINLPYRITGGKLVVMETCTFTRKDLAKLLAEME